MMSESLRVAAVQMCAVVGDVAANLEKAHRLVCRAFDQGAEWVILPEFFTSATAFHPTMLDAARPLNGEPMQLLLALARDHQGVVGGSYLAQRDGQTYNTFVLAFPDGSVYLHDKDQPTMWENCYYIGGSDDGLLETPAGSVGVALCWEQVRTRTIRRLFGRVDWVLSGSCWWGVPDGVPLDHPLRPYLLGMLRTTPVTLAKMLGVPVIHASHAGHFETFRPPDEAQLEGRSFLGETQIVDGHGQVLAHLSEEDGDGMAVATITPGRIDGPLLPIPNGFWIPDMWPILLDEWERLNQFGQDYYQQHMTEKS
jgi:predicted amidohydrolase